MAPGRQALDVEIWFYRAPNTFFPLAGSTFIAVLLALTKNDVLAKFVAAPALLFLFIALVTLIRRLGTKPGVAAMIAAACVLSRPFVTQVTLGKDDLFTAAFYIVLVVALPRPPQERFGPWRTGIALGLLLASKYTMLYAFPVLVLMLDAPSIAGKPFKRTLIIALVAFVLAGPWYLHNWAMTGNPIYPLDVAPAGKLLLPGMMQIMRSKMLATPAGIWEVFTVGYYSMPPVLIVLLAVGFLSAVIAASNQLLREPLFRATILGPVLAIAAFIMISPYGEIRFAYPALLLLFACIGIAIQFLPWLVQVSIGVALALIAAATAFTLHQGLALQTEPVVQLLLTAIIVGTVGFAWWAIWHNVAQRLHAHPPGPRPVHGAGHVRLRQL